MKSGRNVLGACIGGVTSGRGLYAKLGNVKKGNIELPTR